MNVIKSKVYGHGFYAKGLRFMSLSLALWAMKQKVNMEYCYKTSREAVCGKAAYSESAPDQRGQHGSKLDISKIGVANRCLNMH